MPYKLKQKKLECDRRYREKHREKLRRESLEAYYRSDGIVKKQHDAWRKRNKETIYRKRKELYYLDVEKSRKYYRDYRRKNKLEFNQYQREYRAKNRDHILKLEYSSRAKMPLKVKEWKKKWRENNPDYIREYCEKNRERIEQRRKEWYKTFKEENPELVKAHNQKQKAMRKKAGKITVVMIQKAYENNIKKFKTLTCILCYRPIKFGEDSLEHRTPIGRGGINIQRNLGVSHLRCNLKKNTMTMPEWFKKYPKYKIKVEHRDYRHDERGR